MLDIRIIMSPWEHDGAFSKECVGFDC